MQDVEMTMPAQEQGRAAAGGLQGVLHLKTVLLDHREGWEEEKDCWGEGCQEAKREQ